MTNNKVIPIVVACLISGNEVLLLKRTKEPFKGQWSLPGGKIDFGEFADQAVRREIKEETGLQVDSFQYSGLVCEIIFDEKHPDHILYQHLVHVFVAETLKQECSNSPEGDLAWFNLNEIDILKYSLVATDYHILDEMLLNNQSGLYNSLVSFSSGQYQCRDFVLVNQSG